MQFAREHLTLLLSGIGVFYVAVRLYAISGGSPETYAILLQAQGTGTIVLSAVLGLAPFIPFFVLCMYPLWQSASTGYLIRRRDILPLAVVLAVALVVTPRIAIIPLLVGVVWLLLAVGLAYSVQYLGQLVKETRQGASGGGSRMDGLDPGTSVDVSSASISPQRLEELGPSLKVLEDASEAITEVRSIMNQKGMRLPTVSNELLDHIDDFMVRVGKVGEPELATMAESCLSRLRRLRKMTKTVRFTTRLSVYGVSIIIPMTAVSMVFLAIVEDPWLPLERIDTANGYSVGYVLESDDESVTLLREDPRKVVRIEGVRSRTYCTSSSESVFPDLVPKAAVRPLLLRNEAGAYPACD